jgi:glycosyltransferase involved in cell wall biosynthesis
MLVAVAAVPVLIWLYLLFGRGGFWRIRIEQATAAANPRRVIAVIPARNEADVIGRALESLAPQVSEIVVVDDASTDATARIAEEVDVLDGKALPPGWTGKLWALAQGVEHALTLEPDYLLFTDADIEHGRGSIAELVARAEERNLDLASYMVQLACVTTAARALIPAFVFFFFEALSAEVDRLRSIPDSRRRGWLHSDSPAGARANGRDRGHPQRSHR